GKASCVFDGATTAGDYVVASTTVGGDCHDSGATQPTVQIIGRVLSTNGGAGTYTIALKPEALTATASAPTFDSTGTGLGAPAGNGAFTFPASTGNNLSLTGTAPVSSSSAGTSGGTLLSLNGATGGATTGSATTAGVGQGHSNVAGNGGSGAGGTNAIGGKGGSLVFTAGNGGASSGTAINSNGGDITLTSGAAGTGGSGTAGTGGVISLNTATISANGLTLLFPNTGTGTIASGSSQNLTITAGGNSI